MKKSILQKIEEFFVVTPKEAGIQGYTFEELVEKMKPGPVTPNPSRNEFARLARLYLDPDSPRRKHKTIPPSSSLSHPADKHN